MKLNIFLSPAWSRSCWIFEVFYTLTSASLLHCLCVKHFSIMSRSVELQKRIIREQIKTVTKTAKMCDFSDYNGGWITGFTNRLPPFLLFYIFLISISVSDILRPILVVVIQIMAIRMLNKLNYRFYAHLAINSNNFYYPSFLRTHVLYDKESIDVSRLWDPIVEIAINAVV